MSTYIEWLRDTKLDEDSMLGDLARDLDDDSCLPNGLYADVVMHVVTAHRPLRTVLRLLAEAHASYTQGLAVG